MFNQISKFSFLFVFAIAMIFTACDKESISDLTTENFTIEETEQNFANKGGDKGNRGSKGKCFDVVFPVSIAFPEGTTAEVADATALKEAKQAWKEANPDAEEGPSLVYPIQIDQDGTISDIADEEALKAAAAACKGGRGGDRGGRGGKCFQPVFPFSIAFSDGSTVEVADKDAAKAAKEAYKAANPDAEGRSTIVMPFDVQLRDSSVVTIDSEEALAALKETCGSDRGGRGGRGGNGKGGNKCFQAVYPINIVFPDGSTVAIEDKAGKRTAIQTWKEANPDAEGRLDVSIAFPLTVTLADESTVTLTTQEELDALKETCEGNGRN